MKTNDLPEFARLLKLLGDVYRYAITEELGDAFWQIFKKYDLKEIEQAIYYHMSTPSGQQHDCARMPQPGDIIAWIEGTPEAKALAAWSKVEKTIRRIGRYDSVMFDDPVIHQVIYDMGGWTNLCNTRIKILVIVRTNFKNVIKSFCENQHSTRSRIYPVFFLIIHPYALCNPSSQIETKTQDKSGSVSIRYQAKRDSRLIYENTKTKTQLL